MRDSRPHQRPDPVHFSPGDSVAVVRMRIGGPPYIEGRAEIRALAREPHHYWVHFYDDPTLRLRVVHGAFQRDPENVLAALLDLWRAEQALDASLSDFFPDQTP